MNKVHVVLADDDVDDYYIFNSAVQQSKIPIELTVAEDGQKLIKYLNSNPLPDIIFLDINMPFKNGIECLNEIRADEKYNKVPVVMYSTTKNRLNVEASYKAGANLYIVKPDTFEEVDKMVQTICSKKWVSSVQPRAIENFIVNSF